MSANGTSILIPTVSSIASGFIGGLLSILIFEGLRGMLAPTFYRKRLYIGNISYYKNYPGLDPYWYIPIEVRARNAWKIVIPTINDVEATINFNKEQFSTVWIKEPMDIPSVNLNVDSRHRVMLATLRGDILRPIDTVTGAQLLGDQDIILELKSGQTPIGKWIFKDAIIAGVVKEIGPKKLEK